MTAQRAAAALCAALLATGCPRSEREAAPTSAEPSTAPRAVSEPASAPPSTDDRARERAVMVRETIAKRGVDDPRVLAALRKVPRHRFVPESVRDMAYADRPLPIGSGQTISQPYIVAAMTEAAAPKATDRCLEIGTGSGYQAAVLAEVCRDVWSIEYLEDVAREGERNLRAAGYGADRVRLRVGDGYRGWPTAAPFDVILVTAAPDHVPKPLLEQLSPGGRLVIPVGPTHSAQSLERWTRVGKGTAREAFRVERLMGVRFVPFLGDHAIE